MKLLILFCALFALIECKPQCHDSKDPNCGVTVEVGVYIEALCPDSKAFVNNQLFPTFNKLYTASPPILVVNLVPFGNAHYTFLANSTKNPRVNYTCQHGEQECIGNILQSCAVIKYDIEKSLGLVNCMFASPDWRTPPTSAAECAKQVGIDYNVLNECYDSNDGEAIEYFMAGQTNSLVPAHNWVPWITINGQHTDEIQTRATTDLLKLVCDTYPGSPKPKACDSA